MDALLNEIQIEQVQESSHTTICGWLNVINIYNNQITKPGCLFDTDSTDMIIMNFCINIDYIVGITCSTFKMYSQWNMSILKHQNCELSDKVKKICQDKVAVLF